MEHKIFMKMENGLHKKSKQTQDSEEDFAHKITRSPRLEQVGTLTNSVKQESSYRKEETLNQLVYRQKELSLIDFQSMMKILASKI